MHAFFACALTVQAVNTAFAALIKAKNADEAQPKLPTASSEQG